MSMQVDRRPVEVPVLARVLWAQLRLSLNRVVLLPLSNTGVPGFHEHISPLIFT